MTKSNLNTVAETDLGYGQLLAVLLRRRFWFLGIFCSVLSITALITLVMRPTYESSMQLLVEPNYQEKKGAGEPGAESQFAEANVKRDYATQLNLMRSPQLIGRAVDLLRPEYPTIDLEEVEESLVLTQVLEDNASSEDIDTNIFQAVYIDRDPVKTQRVLETLQRVYQDYNLEQQQQRLNKGLAFVNKQLPAISQSVTQAETALEQFRQNQNLIDPEQQAEVVANALSAIKQERRALRAQYQDYLANYKVLQQQLGRSSKAGLTASRLSQSSRYQALLNEIQRTEFILAQQRQRFTDTNPVIQELVEQRQKQLALLWQEGGRVLGTPAQANSTGSLSEGQLGKSDLDLASQLADVQKKLSGLKAGDQNLAKTEQQLAAELNQFPSLLAEYNRLQPEIETRRGTLERLLETRQALGLEAARGGFNWQVVQASQLGEQMGPNIKQNLLLGVVVGLFLGSIAVFIREAADDAVHTSDELKRQVALPLLGMIPELPQAKVGEPIMTLSFRKPQAVAPSTIELIQWPPFRESLDLIYKNIQLLTAFPLSSLVVSSTLAGEGKSTLALGLAMSAARLHQRVLLIDADLRRPSLHKQLNLPNEQGLATLLASDTSVANLSSVPPSGSNIDILTSGPTPADPVKLLSSQRMKELMAAFEQTYDLVLLDAPPVLGMVDAIQAASFCSGVVMVGRIGRVTQTELAQATAMLSKLNVIGVIANGDSSPTYSYAPYVEQRVSPSFRLYSL